MTLLQKCRFFLFGTWFRKGLTLFILLPAVLFFLLNILFPLKASIDYSTVITAKDGTVLQAFLSQDEKWRMMVEPEEISPRLKKAILYKEDKYFYYHPGINPVAVIRAILNNVFQARRTSGASTITMQVARLLYPAKRTYLNKCVELFRAFQLELNFSKEEILRLYFNLVPYGGNIEGVKAASLLYYGRLPEKLSLGQLTTLAIIPNRPGSLRIGRNSEALTAARNKWLFRMKSDRVFPDKDIEDALQEPLDAVRSDAPMLAPHLAFRLKYNHSQVPVIHTTIDPKKQQKVMSMTNQYSKRLQGDGIYNAAVLVVNNRTHCVEAYVGSPDFGDSEHSGQVDGVIAVRSPGSTLKPLVYALAFDQGLLTPKQVVADVPVNYGGYAPENFNSKFNGNVTVENALMNSLNVPAVKALHLIGLQLMIDKLKDANFEQTRKTEKSLGLSLVLGGCGVKLEELTGLFSALANEGNFSPLKYTRDDKPLPVVQLVSPASAFMTAEILSRVNRPELPSFVQENTVHIPRIAWKTGTSYGRRDAWSIGYNKNYTIGVWIGNFNGVGIPELSGAEMATPLLFELFNTIDYNARSEWYVQPEALDFRLVCTESGKLPSENCGHTVIDYFLPGISSVETCDHLKSTDVSADEKISYCTSCRPPTGYKTILYPNLDPDIVSFYVSEHIAFKKIPEHNPGCSRIFSGHQPVITSLADRKEYLVEKGSGNQLQLSCTAANDVGKVFWYLNDRFYKSGRVDEKIFFTPESGALKISCSDDKGRNSDIQITIRYY